MRHQLKSTVLALVLIGGMSFGVLAGATASAAATAPPTTFVGIPSNGATVSEAIWLDAGASSPVGIASVAFEVSGGSISDKVVGTGVLTRYGYIGGWNTRNVTNGTYTIQSVATDTAGVSTTSAPITVMVANPPLSTTVIIPASGATLDSAAGYVLDATASAGATSVNFDVEGVTLSATPTIVGWIYELPPTPPCSSCVQEELPGAPLQSVATYPGGATASSATIMVNLVFYVVEIPPP